MALFDINSFLTNTFVFQFFIPFIILFAILWGLLEAINVFHSSRVKIVIALGFALVASYTNPWILAYIATLGSYAAVILFGLLFLFGVVRWGLGRGKEIYIETAPYKKQIDDIAKKVEKLQRKLETQSPQQQIETMKTIRALEIKAEILRRREATLH